MMFSFKRRKKHLEPARSSFDLSAFVSPTSNYAQPDWAKISAYQQQTDEDPVQFWNAVAHAWTQRVASDTHKTLQSENFLLVYPKTVSKPGMLLDYSEATRQRILRRLPGIALDEGHGIWVIFVFDNADLYDQYQEAAYGRASAIPSSGLFVNDGYGHFLFPYLDQGFSEGVVAHELTHALMSHLPQAPLWVHEGVAVNMEHDLAGSAPLEYDKFRQSQWTKATIKKLFNGKAFQDVKLSEHAYLTARLLVMSLVKLDYNRFTGFVQEARQEDGGFAAARKWFDVDLSEMADHLAHS